MKTFIDYFNFSLKVLVIICEFIRPVSMKPEFAYRWP